MKFLFFILFSLFLFSNNIWSQLSDNGKKIAHFSVGGNVAGAVYLTTFRTTESKKKSLVVSIVSGAIAGCLKETFDKYISKEKFRLSDMGYTSAGGIVGSFTCYLLIKKPKPKYFIRNY